MPDIINKHHPDIDAEQSRMKRLAWFIGLYLAGLLTTFLLVYLLRALMVGLN